MVRYLWVVTSTPTVFHFGVRNASQIHNSILYYRLTRMEFRTIIFTIWLIQYYNHGINSKITTIMLVNVHNYNLIFILYVIVFFSLSLFFVMYLNSLRRRRKNKVVFEEAADVKVPGYFYSLSFTAQRKLYYGVGTFNLLLYILSLFFFIIMIYIALLDFGLNPSDSNPLYIINLNKNSNNMGRGNNFRCRWIIRNEPLICEVVEIFGLKKWMSRERPSHRSLFVVDRMYDV